MTELRNAFGKESQEVLHGRLLDMGLERGRAYAVASSIPDGVYEFEAHAEYGIPVKGITKQEVSQYNSLFDKYKP